MPNTIRFTCCTLRINYSSRILEKRDRPSRDKKNSCITPSTNRGWEGWRKLTFHSIQARERGKEREFSEKKRLIRKNAHPNNPNTKARKKEEESHKFTFAGKFSFLKLRTFFQEPEINDELSGLSRVRNKEYSFRMPYSTRMICPPTVL